MKLDYTAGCVNFRDVGEFVNLIKGKDILPLHKLYRGGNIDYVQDIAEINHVQSIFNLRNRADFENWEADYFHFPMSNKIEKYDTKQKEVQIWLNQILKVFENSELKFPVLIHCLSGKDRTGIVVAAILLILDIPSDIIIEEYLLSDGEVSQELIVQAIEGMKNIEKYFNRVNIQQVKENILS